MCVPPLVEVALTLYTNGLGPDRHYGGTASSAPPSRPLASGWMRNPPELPDAAIIGALRVGFGVEAAALVRLPVGNDADSWAYRVEVARDPRGS